MEAVPQAVADAWLHSVAANPLAGAFAMVVLVISMQYVRHLLPFMNGAGGGGGKGEREPPRAMERLVDLTERAAEHAEGIADELRKQNELNRRLCETLERSERLLLEIATRDKASAAALPRRAPRAAD